MRLPIRPLPVLITVATAILSLSFVSSAASTEDPLAETRRPMWGQDSASAPTTDVAALRQRLEELVVQALDEPGAVGLSVAVAIGDEMVLAGGYGIAEAEHGVPANGETMFRIGSVTKQFTAAAIMRLLEKGELGLGDLLTDHVPDYPMQGHEVTILHLLTHTSGIKSYTGLGPAWQNTVAHELSHEELLACFQNEPFDFAPGERFLYNNSGYYLLGMIVENATGMKYGDYLRKELAAPLGLTRTRIGSNADLIENRAQGYRMIDGELANDALIGMNQPGAAGAILSTAEDLVRWQIALVGGKVVAPDSYEMMTTPFLLNGGHETKYGFGLSLGVFDGHPVVQHGGGIFGFNSMLAYHPEAKLSVAVISNCEGYRSGQLAARLTSAALE